MKLCIHVRPRDDKQGWAVDVFDGRLDDGPLAAFPDLVEACRLARRFIDCLPGGGEDAVDAIDRALAKAGVQP